MRINNNGLLITSALVVSTALLAGYAGQSVAADAGLSPAVEAELKALVAKYSDVPGFEPPALLSTLRRHLRVSCFIRSL